MTTVMIVGPVSIRDRTGERESEASLDSVEPEVDSISATPWVLGAYLKQAVRRWPWWVQVGLIFAVSRLISWAIFAAIGQHQGVNPWGSSSPDYLHFINFWDSTWYRTIFDSGYPSVIPRTATGVAQENPWAFYPLYPLLVKALSLATALPWLVLAPAVSVLCALGATLIIYRLFRHFASTTTALWGVIFFLTFPVSPVLQIPYAESMNTLLLAAALYLLVRGRYLTAMPVVLLLALSRPTGAPFALMVVAFAVVRLVSHRRYGTSLTPGTVVRLALLLATSALAAVAWPTIAWLTTGELTAYTDSETAWRGGTLVPFLPWLKESIFLVGPYAGPVLLLLLVVGFGLLLNSRPVRSIGVELRLWCAAYFVYILAFLDPQTSTFRMLLPLFPLALAAAAISRSRAYRGSVVLMFVLLQIVWVAWLWDWTQLPGGGDYPP